MKGMASVLSTVNAPYSAYLDGEALAVCLSDPAAAMDHPGHLSSFFGEVPPEDQLAFAASVGIPKADLVAAAKAFADYSGEDYPLAK